MKRKSFLNISVSLVIILLIVILPPVIAPIVHTNDSPESAIRKYIYEEGHPYQSFLAIIEKKDIHDPVYGELYHVIWNDWDDVTGMTRNFFYVKKTENNKYVVNSAGTGP